MKAQLIEISPKTILIAAAIIIGLLVAWEIRIVFIMLFAAFILNAAIRPAVDYLEKYRIPRFLSIVIIYVVFLGVLGILTVTLINQSIQQLTTLVNQLPSIISKLITDLLNTFPSLVNYLNPEAIKNSLNDLVVNFLSLGTNVFTSSVSGALGIINFAVSTSLTVALIIIISIYMLVRGDNVYDGVLAWVGPKARREYAELIKDIELKLGNWLRAQLLLMVVVGLVVYLGLIIPALFIPDYTLQNYALPIAFLVSILEVVPGTGLLIGGILATILALGTGPGWIAIYTIILFGGLQQAETIYIVPTVMNKIVGVDPILTIIGLFVGFILFQYVGIILAVPFIAAVQMLIEFHFEHGNGTAVQKAASKIS